MPRILLALPFLMFLLALAVRGRREDAPVPVAGRVKRDAAPAAEPADPLRGIAVALAKQSRIQSALWTPVPWKDPFELPLSEMIPFLEKAGAVRIVVNEKALGRAKGEADYDARRVNVRLPDMQGMPLGMMLQEMCRQFDGDFRILPTHIEIVSREDTGRGDGPVELYDPPTFLRRPDVGPLPSYYRGRNQALAAMLRCNVAFDDKEETNLDDGFKILIRRAADSMGHRKVETQLLFCRLDRLSPAVKFASRTRPLAVWLDDLCGQAGLRWCIAGGRIVIYEAGRWENGAAASRVGGEPDIPACGRNEPSRTG